MTIFGPDLSSFEHGVNVAALPAPFVLMKCTEGTYYADGDYGIWLGQARASGKIAVAYHFISGQDPDGQAAWLASHIGDRSLPVMLDWEPEGTYKPPLAQLLAVADAMVRQGLRPKLAYAPRWHWSNIGSPSLAGLTQRGIGLVSSSYPGGAGYPGDDGPGWQPYGGVTPLIWQYTDAATLGGQRVGDMNAFKGAVEELAAFLGTSTAGSTPSTPQGVPMGTIPPSIAQKWPELAGDFPPNATFTDESALIWADGGARAAALYALQARDAINALAARYQPAPAAQVDVNALAAALGPLLAGGASADEVATAVVDHLAQKLGG